jgi:hypothetical protein
MTPCHVPSHAPVVDLYVTAREARQLVEGLRHQELTGWAAHRCVIVGNPTRDGRVYLLSSIVRMKQRQQERRHER